MPKLFRAHPLSERNKGLSKVNIEEINKEFNTNVANLQQIKEQIAMISQELANNIAILDIKEPNDLFVGKLQKIADLTQQRTKLIEDLNILLQTTQSIQTLMTNHHIPIISDALGEMPWDDYKSTLTELIVKKTTYEADLARKQEERVIYNKALNAKVIEQLKVTEDAYTDLSLNLEKLKQLTEQIIPQGIQKFKFPPQDQENYQQNCATAKLKLNAIREQIMVIEHSLDKIDVTFSKDTKSDLQAKKELLALKVADYEKSITSYQQQDILYNAYKLASNSKEKTENYEKLIVLIAENKQLQTENRLIELLSLAVGASDQELARILYNYYVKAPYFTKDNLKDRLNSLLLTAVKTGDMKAYKHLLALGADINYKDKDGNTALHLTVINKDKVFTKQLVDDFCDVNIYNNKGETPLHIAVGSLETNATESVACTEALLGAVSLDLYAKNNEGKTALDIVRNSSLIGNVFKVFTNTNPNEAALIKMLTAHTLNTTTFPSAEQGFYSKHVNDSDMSTVLEPIAESYRYYESRVNKALEQLVKVKERFNQLEQPPIASQDRQRRENLREIALLEKEIGKARQQLDGRIAELNMLAIQEPSHRKAPFLKKCEEARDKLDNQKSKLITLITDLRLQNDPVEKRAIDIKTALIINNHLQGYLNSLKANYKELSTLEQNLNSANNFITSVEKYNKILTTNVNILQLIVKLNGALPNETGTSKEANYIINALKEVIQELSPETKNKQLQDKKEDCVKLQNFIQAVNTSDKSIDAELNKLKQEQLNFMQLIRQHQQLPSMANDPSKTIKTYMDRYEALLQQLIARKDKLVSLKQELKDQDVYAKVLTDIELNLSNSEAAYKQQLAKLSEQHAKLKLYDAIANPQTANGGMFTSQSHNGKGQQIKALLTQDGINKETIQDAICYAVKQEQNTILEILAQCNNYTININELNIDGEHLVHIAAKNNNWQTFNKLVELGADPFVKDQNGKIPAELCSKTNADKFINRQEITGSVLKAAEKLTWSQTLGPDYDYQKHVNVRIEMQYYEKRLNEIKLAITNTDGNEKQSLQIQLEKLKQAYDNRIINIGSEYKIIDKERFNNYLEELKKPIESTYTDLHQRVTLKQNLVR